MQRDYRKVFRTIIEKVLDNASLAGLIPLDWGNFVSVDVAAPAMEVRDRGAEANANRVYYDMGIKSKHTICADLGMNYTREQAFIQEEYKTAAIPPEKAYDDVNNKDNTDSANNIDTQPDMDAKIQTDDKPTAVKDKDGSKEKKSKRA
jgi:hypothetical protein